MEHDLFLGYSVDFNKLLSFGFLCEENKYVFKKNIENDSFQIIISISLEGNVSGQVFDLDLGDEYTSFRIENNSGEFAGTIRTIFEETLLDIRNNCFFKQEFIGSQANRISKMIKDCYGDNPFFEWESYPNFGVFKHKRTHKWYALIMNIPMNKIKAGDGMVDVINVKLSEEKISSLLNHTGFFLAYHMNKKNWISIILDDTLSDEDIMNFIHESYSFASGSNNSKLIQNEWIIPANPRYYDIETAFLDNNIITWKQSTCIQTGDIVYIYVGAPISALLYKCVVLENSIPYFYHDSNVQMEKVMRIKLLEKYDSSKCPFSKMKEYHVNAVRGPRHMPINLKEYLSR